MKQFPQISLPDAICFVWQTSAYFKKLTGGGELYESTLTELPGRTISSWKGSTTLRAAVKNVRLGEADGLKNFHPQKWVPNAMK